MIKWPGAKNERINIPGIKIPIFAKIMIFHVILKIWKSIFFKYYCNTKAKLKINIKYYWKILVLYCHGYINCAENSPKFPEIGFRKFSVKMSTEFEDILDFGSIFRKF